MRDLELRGAGNLLGDEQSGHVAAVGFELYCELLAEAVAELQGGARRRRGRCAWTPRSTPTCRPSYVPLEAVKIDLHRRLALAGSGLRPARAAGRGGRPLRPAARSGREPVRRSTRRGCWPPSWAPRWSSCAAARLTVSPLRMDSAQVRELKERVPQAHLQRGRRERSRSRLELQPNSNGRAQYAGGIGDARCYNRIAPRNSGVTCFYESSPHSSPPLLLAAVAVSAACGGGSSSSSSSASLDERRRRRGRRHAHHRRSSSTT